MSVAVVLFTSNLRLHDNPPLHAAARTAEEVVPLFVLDPAVSDSGFDSPNRRAFLADCLADLDAALRGRGGRLVVRSGDVVEQVCAVAAATEADAVHLAAGVSGFAHRREERLAEALRSQGRRLHVHDAVVTAVAPGEVTPVGSDHFAVFTPYFRRWQQVALRTPLGPPARLRSPEGVGSEPVPSRAGVRGVSPGLAAGGEREGRRRSAAWRAELMDGYGDHHDDLAGDTTSRLSPHLHFGTLSATELVHLAREHGGPGAEAFVRQLAWRDFHHQVLAARPRASWSDYRPREGLRRTESSAAPEVEAWKAGRTGFPVVDAAMRQLRHEGWMHNRGRLLTGSFLAKTLGVDWRVGARHFLDLLVDGDIANNQMNWQWVAGTGTDTRPNRVLNPVVQARRFDPDGSYVRRWVAELRGLEGPAVHEPWKLTDAERARYDYPTPLVDLALASERFRRSRGRG